MLGAKLLKYINGDRTMNEKKEEDFIGFINGEIEKEIGSPVFSAPPPADEPSDGRKLQDKSDGKSFVLHDFDTPHDKEMAIFTHAKKFSEYIFVVTKKSPVSLRWSIVSRLQNISVDIIEDLYRANFADGEERENFQKKAMTDINIADHYAVTAKTMQAINFHRLTVIARQIYELKKLLYGWMRSDKRRTKTQDG